MADFFKACCLFLSEGLLLLALLPSLVVAEDAEIFVHYMPWYSADAEHQQWGWHWTMNRFDPNKVDSNGRRQIASHHYPLVGPYDSNDAHVLEYHVLLMKLSGINGVIVDWYGTKDFRDYAMIHRNTQALIPWLKKANLKYTFCYEDQTIKHLIEAGEIEPTADIGEFVGELNFLADNYFNDESWVKVDSQPALLVFGPQHFEAGAWTEAMKQCKTAPLVFGLPHLANKFKLKGAFAWPPVTGGATLKSDQWRKKLESTYSNNQDRQLIPTVFPGFHDIYKEAKIHESYGFIDDRNGLTFTQTLKLAMATGSPLIQVATWNDFGEGTVIEPTREFGYRYLETLQKAADVSAEKQDLELPLHLLELRRSGSKKADAASEALFDGQYNRARTLLKTRN